ncbi:MAG: hypothetical protein Q7T33_00945 [Dehalococcoidia bacterium]|nr:hypothetical protein [Dehalococcoidia bacterium]
MQEAIGLKRSRFRIRYLVILVVLVAAAAGLGTGLYLWLQDDGGESVRVVTAVQFPYPNGWDEQSLTEADRNAGLVLSLERQRPDASFLARTVITRLPADFDLNQLADESEAALSSEIESFELLRGSVVSVGPYDAVKLNYLQTDEAGVDHEVIMVIVPTPNQTFYLTFRAEKTDFQQIEDEGLEIADTFAAYVSAGSQ